MKRCLLLCKLGFKPNVTVSEIAVDGLVIPLTIATVIGQWWLLSNLGVYGIILLEPTTFSLAKLQSWWLSTVGSNAFELWNPGIMRSLKKNKSKEKLVWWICVMAKSQLFYVEVGLSTNMLHVNFKGNVGYIRTFSLSCGRSLKGQSKGQFK